MANYNLVVDSTFRPFSFEERLKPLQMIKEETDRKVQAMYDTITEASQYKHLIDPIRDPNTYNMYSEYENQLLDRASRLAAGDLQAFDNRAMLDLRRKFSSDITPIKIAYNKRISDIEQQRKEDLADPTMLRESRATDYSLDDYIRGGGTVDYRSISGNTLVGLTAKAVSGYANKIVNNPEEFQHILNNQYVQRKVQMGYSLEQVLAAAAMEENAPEELKGVVNDIRALSGVQDWNVSNREKQYLMSEVDRYIGIGLRGAIGKEDIETLRNPNASQPNDGILRKVPYVDSSGNKYNYHPTLGIWTDDNGNLTAMPKEAEDLVGRTPSPTATTPTTPGTNIVGQQISTTLLSPSGEGSSISYSSSLSEADISEYNKVDWHGTLTKDKAANKALKRAVEEHLKSFNIKYIDAPHLFDLYEKSPSEEEKKKNKNAKSQYLLVPNSDFYNKFGIVKKPAGR